MPVYGLYGGYNYYGLLCHVSILYYLHFQGDGVHVVFSTPGFKGRGKPCHETRETTKLRTAMDKLNLQLFAGQ